MSNKFRRPANILEDDAHDKNLIRLENHGQVLIKLLKDGGLIYPQVKAL